MEGLSKSVLWNIWDLLLIDDSGCVSAIRTYLGIWDFVCPASAREALAVGCPSVCPEARVLRGPGREVGFGEARRVSTGSRSVTASWPQAEAWREAVGVLGKVFMPATRMWACVHTHALPHSHTHARTLTHVQTHACTPTHTPTASHTHSSFAHPASCRPAQSQTLTRSHMLTHSPAHTRARTHTSLTTCPGMPAHRKQAPPLAGQMRSKGKLGGFRAPQLAHGAHLPRAHVFTPVGARGCRQGLACLGDQSSSCPLCIRGNTPWVPGWGRPCVSFRGAGAYCFYCVYRCTRTCGHTDRLGNTAGRLFQKRFHVI